MDNPTQPAPQPQPTVNIAQNVLDRANRTGQMLSPWLQRYATSARPIPLSQRQRPASMTTQNTFLMLDRLEHVTQPAAWQPNVGSLKPGMTDNFAAAVEQRFEFSPIGVKPIIRDNEGETAPPDMAYPPLSAAGAPPEPKPAQPDPRQVMRQFQAARAARTGEPEPPPPGTPQGPASTAPAPEPATPMLQPPPSSPLARLLEQFPDAKGGQVIPPPPKSNKKKKPAKPRISPNTRIFSRVQEGTAGNLPDPAAGPREPSLQPRNAEAEKPLKIKPSPITPRAADREPSTQKPASGAEDGDAEAEVASTTTTPLPIPGAPVAWPDSELTLTPPSAPPAGPVILPDAPPSAPPAGPAILPDAPPSAPSAGPVILPDAPPSAPPAGPITILPDAPPSAPPAEPDLPLHRAPADTGAPLTPATPGQPTAPKVARPAASEPAPQMPATGPQPQPPATPSAPDERSVAGPQKAAIQPPAADSDVPPAAVTPRQPAPAIPADEVQPDRLMPPGETDTPRLAPDDAPVLDISLTDLPLARPPQLASPADIAPAEQGALQARPAQPTGGAPEAAAASAPVPPRSEIKPVEEKPVSLSPASADAGKLEEPSRLRLTAADAPPAQPVADLPEMPLAASPTAIQPHPATPPPAPIIRSQPDITPVFPPVAEKPARPTPAETEIEPPAKRSLIFLDREVLTRTAIEPDLPPAQPPVPGEPPLMRRLSRPKPTPKLFARQAREQLTARGWRFKTKPGESSGGESRRVIQTARSLETSSSQGKPLAEQPRTQMEGFLQRDFSGVRIHRADLGALNVQAATRGSDVYVDRSVNEDFSQPESLALLGHELTHVTQQSRPAASSPTSSVARMPVDVGADEAEANRTEQSVYRFARTGEMPLGPAPVQRAPENEGRITENVLADSQFFEASQSLSEQQETGTDSPEGDNSNLELFDGLQTMFEEMLDEKLTEMLEAMGIELDEDSKSEQESGPKLDNLARDVLPFVKRLIAVERERRT